MNEITIRYLCEVTDLLGSSTLSIRNVAKNLREKCLKAKDGHGHRFRLPDSLFGRTVLCPLCLSPWSIGRFRMRIISNGSTKGKKRSLTKLLSKPSDRLSQFQTKLVQRLACQQKNYMELTCYECQKVTKIAFNKSISDSKEVLESSQPSLENVEQVKKKKKRKKKDVFCGLNSSAVAQVRSINSHSQKDMKKLSLKEPIDQKSISMINPQDSFEMLNSFPKNKEYTQDNSNENSNPSENSSYKLNLNSIDSNEYIDIFTRQTICKIKNENTDCHPILDSNIELNNLKDKIGKNETNKDLKENSVELYNIQHDRINNNLKDNKVQLNINKSLLSQPSLNVIQNNKHFNKSKNQNETSFSKLLPSTKKHNNKNPNNDSMLSLSNSSKLTTKSKSTNKKKKSKKQKWKGIQSSFQHYEQSNCKNSLVIKDILNLV